MLSYEPLSLSGYGPIQGVAAVCGAFYASSVRAALAEKKVRLSARFALGWIGFNCIFYKPWGDEYFLFSPHSSWALMVIVVLGVQGAALDYSCADYSNHSGASHDFAEDRDTFHDARLGTLECSFSGGPVLRWRLQRLEL